ncbi:LysR substrate-binding domain-containing protein [Bradyrhizobium sp. Ash2021]|uniref:LysR substrate-binding domain-containing protein n=1 Tax=Bradyrhizobium sp. Ash2021 TaxID=2954771 RepID=UPI0028149D64|nr:LysR substrate-binding domain-containing protein [Bradyrhizobium sp. Ash2021]WMT72082.1 LysR substrate-binding domain-containing protein [Bradyrhizobium sp. Ash2021]
MTNSWASSHVRWSSSELSRGIINLDASQTTGAYWLPERIVQFHAAHPNIDIKLSIDNSDQVAAAAAVSSGSAEIGFVEGTIHEPNLVSGQVGLLRTHHRGRAKHPWSRLRQISKSQITQANCILRERGSGTRSAF